MNRQRKPARNSHGAAAMAFGLIAALIVITLIVITMIVITMIAAFARFANTTMTMWGDVNSKVKEALNS